MTIRTPLLALGATLLLTLGLFAALSRLPRGEASLSEPAENMFIKADRADGFDLTFRWKDFEGKTQQAAFTLSKRDLSDAEREFGYTLEEYERELTAQEERKNEAMIASLKETARRLIERSGYGDHILIVEKDSLTFDLKLSVPFDMQDRVKPAYEEIKSRLAEEFAVASGRVESEMGAAKTAFFKARGIIAEDNRLQVDYLQSVRGNRTRLQGVLDALRSGRDKINLRRFLGLSLSFVQSMPYGVPPLKEGDKFILGFWVPPKVLVNNFGDCDSKGVTFAALWTNFKNYPLILIKVPDHMFIGLAIPSMSTEGLTINGRRYTLCEVSGVKKTPPGVISYYSATFLKSGRYQYEIVSR